MAETTARTEIFKMKTLRIDLPLGLYLYVKNLIKRAPSKAVLALTLIVLIYGSASPTTALPVLPDATLTAVATAQPAPQSLNTWSSRGPWGGSVANLAIAPGNPDILYTWTENNFFKSTDGGVSWNYAGRADSPARYVAIDTFNPETLYITPNVLPTTVFKSTDGGARWKDIGPHDTQVAFLAMDPANPATLYTLDGNFRLSKSTDGGANWSRTGNGLPEYSERGFAIYVVLAVSPGNSQTLYAAAPFKGPENQGLYRSTDGGDNWSRVGVGPFRNASMWQLIVAQANPNVLCASTVEGWFRSTDGGANWSAFSVPDVIISSLAIDPGNVAVVYVGTNDGRVLKSGDGGKSWSEANVGLYSPSYISRLLIDPRNTTNIYAATGSSGVFKSTDGGGHWQQASSGLSVNVQSVAAGRDGGVIAGTSGGAFRSTDDGARWDRAGLPGSVSSWAIDPNNPNIIYAASYLGLYRSMDGGASWSATGTSKGVRSVAIAPGNPTLLYAGTDEDGVIRSTDSGTSWVRISKNLDNAYLLTPDPGNPNTFYAASSSICGWDYCTHLFKSTDGCVTWNISATPSPADEWIGALALDPDNPRILYANDSGSVIKSIDGGETWSTIGSNGLSVTDLVIDPINSATLYAGTNSGVIRTTDGGATWNEFNDGLPADLESRDLAIDPSGTSLHVGTNRGVFDYHFAMPCAEPLLPADQSFAAGGGAGSVKVTAGSECRWTVASNANWIRVTSDGSSGGSGTVSYSVAVNESTALRTGRISIAGRFLTVTQAGVPVRITRAMVSGRELFVFGENFDPGAVILLNGEEQITKQPAAGPQATLIGKKAGKKVKAGDRLQVRNLNGTLSEEFMFTG